MNRLFVIFAVTVAVMAGLYFAFSRSSVSIQESHARTADSATAPVVAVPASPGPAASGAAGNAPPSAPAAPAQLATAETPRADVAPVNTYPLSIANGHARAPDVIRVHQGDRVTLTVAADRAGTLEVHGYRAEVKVEPNAPAVLAFVAAKTGRFGIDMHERGGGHVEVTALEVLPK